MVTIVRVTPAEAAALIATESRSSAIASAPTNHAPQGNNNNENRGGNKHSLSSENSIGMSDREITKRQKKADDFVLDLSDVPPQQPVPKIKGRIKEGASKYTGVSFDKRKNKWQAQVWIEGKLRYIGYYENEEEAAIDYARAVFKYKGEQALDKVKKSVSTGSRFVIDLNGVPPQQPIPKCEHHVKEGASKFTGVYFDRPANKWRANITIDGKQHHIGLYENEEEAAADYAKAVFKYKGQGGLDKARERKSSGSAINIDLSDAPPQLPILKSADLVKEGSSKYAGVCFHKSKNKWMAQIVIEGEKCYIGYYESEEEAAIDYARAVFKYQGQAALDEVGKRNSSAPAIDLTDVPPQPPISKSDGRIKDGASKYVGVYPNKANNKWTAIISIDGKPRYIGSYMNEEDAAIDYARAVFQYQGEEALAKSREQKSSGSKPAINMDLSDVPPQQPVPKIKGHIKEGASKYTGVYFNKSKNKWQAEIKIDGKTRHIGYYENEDEAAVDYARAVFKFKGQEALDKARERNSTGFTIDFSDVSPQHPILKSAGQNREGSSKYAGVTKSGNKWRATITIDGKTRHIGYYENEEEAAIDHARAVFKYQGQEALDKARERKSSGISIDLSDVRPQQPPYQPILRSPKHLLIERRNEGLN